MHLDRLILGSNAIIKTHDQFDSYWPFQLALADRILNLQFPGWLPDFAGGIPFFIWDVNWTFLPIFLGGLSPEPWKTTVITLFEFVLAGVGAHLFLERFFQTRKLASCLGGLLWAVSTFNLTYWRIFDLAALPMILYCSDRLAFEHRRIQRFAFIAGLAVCAMNLWFIKGALFLIPFHFAFIFFTSESWAERRRTLVVFFCFWTFFTILNLPMIAGLLVNALHSSRNLIEWLPYDTSLSALLETVKWFFLNPFAASVVTLGFTATLIVIYGALQFKSWAPLARKIFYYYLAALFLAQFVIYSSWFIAFWKALPISGFRLYRLILVGPFILFIIGVSRLDGLVEFLRGPLWKIALFLAAAAAAVFAYHFGRNVFPCDYLEGAVVLLTAAAVMAGILILRKKRAGSSAYMILFIALILSERLIQINVVRPADFQPPSFTHFFSSDLFDRFRPDRKYDYRIAFVNQHPTVGLYNGYQVAGGIGQYSKRYYHFWDALITGEDDSRAFHDYYHMAYLYADKEKRETSPAQTIKKPGFSPDLLAIHNVRYIFSFNEIETPERWGLVLAHPGNPPERAPGIKRGIQVFRRIFEPIPYFVYEVRNYAPRVYLADSFAVVGNEEEMKSHLRSRPLEDLKQSIVYRQGDLSEGDLRVLEHMKRVSSSGPESAKGAVQIEAYSDNRISIRVEAPRACQLVLNENYFRDWTARIDGQETKILPAFGTFRSVLVEKGKHAVVFEYRPVYVQWAMAASGLGTLIMLMMSFWWATRTGRRGAHPEIIQVSSQQRSQSEGYR